jgi:hypothetical protein
MEAATWTEARMEAVTRTEADGGGNGVAEAVTRTEAMTWMEARTVTEAGTRTVVQTEVVTWTEMPRWKVGTEMRDHLTGPGRGATGA